MNLVLEKWSQLTSSLGVVNPAAGVWYTFVPNPWFTSIEVDPIGWIGGNYGGGGGCHCGSGIV
jgi:hypothetical protein